MVTTERAPEPCGSGPGLSFSANWAWLSCGEVDAVLVDPIESDAEVVVAEVDWRVGIDVVRAVSAVVCDDPADGRVGHASIAPFSLRSTRCHTPRASSYPNS